MRRGVALSAAGLALLALVLLAIPWKREQTRSERAEQYARRLARQIVDDEAQLRVLRASNDRTRSWNEATLRDCDTRWRAGEQATLSPVLESPQAEQFRAWMRASNGALTQLFVMDAKGLLVVADRRTGDCWQGDEAQFREVFPSGSRGIYVDRAEGGSHRWVSVPLTINGRNEGAITAGIDADRIP